MPVLKVANLLLLNTVLLVAGRALPQMQSLASKDTFREAGLSREETREIITAVEQSAYDTPESWTKELRVRRVDLGANAGLILQGTNLLCGGTGNCQIFVLRKASGKWISLFGNEQAPIADGFQFGPGITNGIKEFTITTEAGTRITYKFHGKVYQRK